MIQVENLVKKYGNHLAVDHLSFTIEKGKIYGFLGPNGAGKSTTMNIITGYLGATEGMVKINGHDVLKEPEAAKKSIGYLPEIPPLYTEMTVAEYLQFAAELKKIPQNQREDQIAEVVRMAKLEDVKDRLIQNLSKGYRQRVGLAQAILGFPEIIILDEPTVGLDPKQIIEIRELIRGLAKQHTVILSSHILAEVREVCDYILIIANGKLVASDTPENLEENIGSRGYIEVQSHASESEMRQVLNGVSQIQSVEYSVEPESGSRRVDQSEPESGSPREDQSEPESGSRRVDQSEPESGSRREDQSEPESGSPSERRSEPQSENWRENQSKPQREKRITTAHIKIRGNADIREELFRKFAEKQIPLLTLMLRKNTLEDVFLELTQGNEVQTIGNVERKERPTLKVSEMERIESEVNEDDSDL